MQVSSVIKHVTNYFLVNLSVADLLVTLICMPTAVGQVVTRLWYSGEFLCKITSYLQGVSVGASVFTIAAMSVDRCLAIRRPVALRAFSRRTTLVVLVLLWLGAALVCGPLLWVRELAELPLPGRASVYYCIEAWPSESGRAVYDLVSFALLYVVPVAVVVLSYALTGKRLCAASPPFDGRDGAAACKQGRTLVRERRRVARLLLLLAALFAACWLPYNVMVLVVDFCSARGGAGGGEARRDCGLGSGARATQLTLLRYSLLLGHANSAVNPLVYCFMTRAFREAARELLWLGPSRPPLAARAHQRCKVRKRPASRAAPEPSPSPVDTPAPAYPLTLLPRRAKRPLG